MKEPESSLSAILSCLKLTHFPMEFGRGPGGVRRMGGGRGEETVELIIVQEKLLEVDPLLNALREFT
jgi:hypothetical protein